jgi:hypothetical protein
VETQEGLIEVAQADVDWIAWPVSYNFIFILFL